MPLKVNAPSTIAVLPRLLRAVDTGPVALGVNRVGEAVSGHAAVPDRPRLVLTVPPVPVTVTGMLAGRGVEIAAAVGCQLR